MKYWIEYIGILFLRNLLKILHIFPIYNNRIILYSFNGKQYSCNPRRITEYMLCHAPNDYEIIWAFKNPEKFKDLVPNNVKRVRYRSFMYYFYAKTAKVVVFNVQGYGELAKRKGQTFIQTWHASNGYKKVGVYLTGIRRRLNLLGHRDYSYVMCGSRNMEKQRIRGSMKFNGPVIEGTPRMDSLIEKDLIGIDTKVYSWLQIPSSKKILLYAPTWRDNRNENDYGLEYESLKNSLEERFGGSWVIAVRLHPNVYKKIDVTSPYVFDVTEYPDMEDLMYVAEAMISDYSSCIWDFSFTYKPCFLLCTDLEKYDFSRSFDLPIDTWGFPLCTTAEQLNQTIINFDSEKFIQSMKKHHADMGSLEDGHATERVCEIITNIMNGRD